MPPVTLEGDTLGEKRKHYNKLVQDAIANKHYELSNISGDDSDIDNLLKIDIASKNRNVDYIIEVMKSNDMLYAATAIKKSTWLITEQQYANIINPEYLHTQLLPSMNTKTFNKLMLHIRLNLKDESRVEGFYEYLKETDNVYKWLQNCSIPFIENVIKNQRVIPLSLFTRLCRRSARFLAYYSLVTHSMYQVKGEILCLLKSHTTEVLNVVEDKTIFNYVPEIRKKKTEFLMKNCKQRVLDNFDKYAGSIDLSVVAKNLNMNEIKAFLYKQARRLGHRLYDLNTLRHFIKRMPTEERFEFARKTFIDKPEMDTLFSEKERRIIEFYIKRYQWFEFARFDVALAEIKKLIRKENSPSKRCEMLSVLVTCTRNNPQQIKILIKYFNEKHINEPFKFKIQFINNLLSQVSTHEIDVETWNILNQLFHSMEVYTESENNVQRCLQSICLYKVLHDEPVPEIVEKKMWFQSFKKIQPKLTQEQNDKMFTYLINSTLTKIQIKNIANESGFGDTVLHLHNALTLLKDWKKDITKFPLIFEKIQELIKMKQENTWKTDMSCLYSIKKSWRKHMFEESLSLSLSEDSCLNALKHKPQLLTRHDKDIDTLRTNNAVSLRRLLDKLRVYWPHSLAQHWTDAYLLHLNKPIGQKAVVKGLFMLLSQNQIVDLSKTHAPNNFKITWGETDQTEISIRKNIAKHLHIARPLIPLDTVLWYAKGDYLQHAVPSLNAILYNMSEVDSREHLPKLLDAPVASLQKFGLHLALYKLKPDVLKSTFLIIWKTTTNLTIRSILFKHTYDQICKVKNPTVEKELWELIRIFINELNSCDNAEIYKKLARVEKVPISIRGEYFMKGYEFLTSLPDSANCEKYVKDLIQYAPKIIELLDEDFVANKLLSRAGYKLCLNESEFLEVLACYVLFGKSEEDQVQKFRRVVGPAMEEAFQCWGSKQSDSYYVQNNLELFLRHLVHSFTIYVTLNKIPVPALLFLEIKTKIEQYLPVLENYVLYTNWKLLVEYVNLVHEQATPMSAFGSSKWTESDADKWRASGIDNPWKDIHLKIAPSLATIIVKYLKEDIEQYGSAIYCLFADALEAMFYKLYFQDNLFVLETLKNMLNENDFIPSYLIVSKLTRKYSNNDELKSVRSEIRKKVVSNPAKIVRVNYYNDFRNIKED